jgi:hypothetical protein
MSTNPNQQFSFNFLRISWHPVTTKSWISTKIVKEIEEPSTQHFYNALIERIKSRQTENYLTRI